MIPRAALAVTVAVLLEADVAWPHRVRGLVAGIADSIDREATAAGWI